MTTLFDILFVADAIEIDGVFIRHFDMACDSDADDDEVALDLALDVDGESFSWSFTVGELKGAMRAPNAAGWQLADANACSIAPYMLAAADALSLEQISDCWGEVDDYSRADWRHDVASGSTNLGYWDWVRHQRESQPRVARS